MRRLLLIAVLLISLTMAAQDKSYDTFSSKIHQLYSSSTDQREMIWSELVKENQIPFIVHDSVAFLYRGEAHSVKWSGDFNGWGNDKTFNNSGRRISGTDIWILKTRFPIDARLDYKLIVDDQWLLDPVNPHQQLSGVGGGSPNSEIRMPAWKRDPITQLNTFVPKGTLREELLLTSRTLGYQLTYSLYVPHGIDTNRELSLPVLYVTDGYEYLHPQMGAMTTILDNLIASGKIEPVIVVFVDHRDPSNRSQNRRMQELAMNVRYLHAFVSELIPEVEKTFRLKTRAATRGILGTSLGGLTAAYFAFSRPDVFGLAGIQSPAFWFRPEIYALCDTVTETSPKVFLTTGTVFDAKEGVEKMKNILEKNACTFQFKEVNQGHSWGHWKDLIDDILIYFYAGK